MSTLYITEAGAFIRRNGGHVVVGRNNEVLFEVPLEMIEDITVFDSVHISAPLLTQLIERSVPVSWLSSYGKYSGTVINTKSIDVFKHKQQFDLLEDREFCLALAKKTILAKTQNQITIVRRYVRNIEDESKVKSIETNLTNMVVFRRCIDQGDDLDVVRGFEGMVAKYYFDSLGKIVPKEFAFSRRSKQPPLDPFNALLGLGYTMLFNEVLAGVINAGLHPFVGFFHALAPGHPALVSDLMEEWRAPVVDSLVLALVKRHSVDAKEDFVYSENETRGCYLNPEGRKLFLGFYNKKVRAENQYMESSHSYRESIYKQCKDYASAIKHKDLSLYTPIEIT